MSCCNTGQSLYIFASNCLNPWALQSLPSVWRLSFDSSLFRLKWACRNLVKSALGITEWKDREDRSMGRGIMRLWYSLRKGFSQQGNIWNWTGPLDVSSLAERTGTVHTCADKVTGTAVFRKGGVSFSEVLILLFSNFPDKTDSWEHSQQLKSCPSVLKGIWPVSWLLTHQSFFLYDHSWARVVVNF